MPRRLQPASDHEFNRLSFRANRAMLKPIFLNGLARLCPHVVAELFSDEILRSAVGQYEWSGYDRWAAAHNLTSTSDYADWLRVVAWSRRRRRTLPSRGAWSHAVTRDSSRARSRGALAGWSHRSDETAIEVFIRWQILRQPWSTIRAGLEAKNVHTTVDSIRDLVSRTAHALSFTPRPGRPGRPS